VIACCSRADASLSRGKLSKSSSAELATLYSCPADMPTRNLRPLAPLAAALLVAGNWLGASGLAGQGVHHHQAARMSMACLYAIEAYGPNAEDLARIVEEALDEVDRVDRLMSHYKAPSDVSRVNREAARHPVTVDAELFDFIAEAMRYNRDSAGAFDITVGPLMKAWGFFRGDGRVPSEEEIASARGHVGGAHVTLDHGARTIAFDAPGVEIDLGGIAKGYAVDRVVGLFRQRGVVAALISAGGSTIYGLGAPPGRAGWDVEIQDPIESGKTALIVQLKDRALSVSGSSEKSFEAGGMTY